MSVASLTSDSTHHQLYYGNESAGSPPGAMYSVFPGGPDGNTAGLWPFQEGSGSTVADVSGHGNNGSFVNSPTWGDGKFGKALCTDNEINRVYIPDSSSLHVQAITVEGWIRFAYHRDNWKIFDKGDKLWLDDACSGIRYYIEDSNGRGSGAECSTSFSPESWHHFAFTYDGAGHVKVWRDGTLAYSRDNPNGVSGPLIANSVALRLGGAPVCLQHLRMSNVARTDFSHGAFALITAEPSVAVGDPINPPEAVSPDLSVQNLAAYNTADGTILQAVVTNQGDGATGNGFWIDLYANHQPTGPGDLTGSIRYWVASPIVAGETITVTTLVTEDGSQGGMAMVQDARALGEATGTLYAQADSTGVLSEPDKGNNISPGIEVCIALADNYESDDTAAIARLISVGTTEAHNFGAAGDQDWFKFDAKAGVAYTIQTSSLGTSADTYLYLYDTDGATPLAANDDYGGTLASRIMWQAPADGTYYVMVKHWNPNVGGCGTSYDLSVTLLGDFEPNCIVDVADIMQVASRWRSRIGDTSYDPTYDLDGDGDIDVVDIMKVAANWGERCECVFLYVLTGDGIVEVSLTGSKQTIVGAHGESYSIEILNNELYVSEETRGGDILVYDLQGNYLKTIPIPPQASEYLCFVTLPNERIALLDNSNDKVYFIDSSGSLLATTNILDTPDYQAQNLDGVVVNNRLILSEDGNNHILQIDLDTYEKSIFRDLTSLPHWLGAITCSEGQYYICGPQTIYAFSEVGDIVQIAEISERNITGIVVIGNSAYVSVNFAGKIYKVDLSNGASSMFASDLNYPKDLER